jgi:hypothetical protein
LSNVDKKKAEHLRRALDHLKQPDGAKKVKDDANLDPQLKQALSGLDDKELKLLAKVNDDLFDAGFGVDNEFRVSMV